MNESKIRVLIVDDEPAARRGVRLLLERDPEVVVIGEAGSGLEAVRKITDEKPDIVILDVQMPEMNGFRVLESVAPVHTPAVIFVTAYDEHALRAFEVHAIDYVLKPYEDERFWTAVRRAKSEIQHRATGELASKLNRLLDFLQVGGNGEVITRDRILLKSGGDIFFLKSDEIDWIEAEGDYMKFYAGGRTHLLRETMGRLEEKLDPRQFVRIHRSTMVNLNRIKKLSPSFAGEYAVFLQDGTKLRLSRGYHARVQELLKSAL
jgi:two-component system, LytTR family, response regulator